MDTSTKPTLGRTMIGLRMETLAELRQTALDLQTNVSVIVRALVSYGLEHLDKADVQEFIDLEVEIEKERRAARGRKGMATRWGSQGRA